MTTLDVAEGSPEIDYSIHSWPKLIFIISVFIIGFYGIYHGYKNYSEVYPIINSNIVYYFITMLGITLGAHRYGTHLGLISPWAEATVVTIAYSAGLQGALDWWIATHMKHHAREDVIGEDPHTPLEGFWHSFVLWLVRKQGCTNPELKYYALPKDPTGVNKRVIEWQSRNHIWLTVLMVLIVPLAIGYIYGDTLGGFLIGCTKIMFVWTFTWIVNSVGHMLGKRTTRSKATNIGWGIFGFILAILTCGESLHANHHASPRYWYLGRKISDGDFGGWFAYCYSILTWRIKFISKISNKEKNFKPA
ncbi:MAG: stearoyl-CoA desaturase (delta-9 desaturase) [Candidatus Paceibacteria bacterium]|jgi:stearoyl-CoA desaturase (delta-9 desaturase)